MSREIDNAEQDNIVTAQNEQHQYCMHLQKDILLASNILFNDNSLLLLLRNFVLFGGDTKDAFAYSPAP